MKSLRHFWNFFCLTAFFFQIATASLPAQGAAVCDFALSLPADYQVLESREDWMLAQSQSHGAQLVALCGPNQLRTSRLSEIPGTDVSDYRELELAAGVRGAVFRKLHKAGKRVVPSVAAYFATRNHEYSFSIVAEQGSKLDPAGRRTDLVAILLNSNFVKAQETTITEAEYRLRLYLFGAGALALFCGVVTFVLRRFLKE